MDNINNETETSNNSGDEHNNVSESNAVNMETSVAIDDSVNKSPESDFMSFVPLIVVFVLLYLLVIRPQQKRIKTHQMMVKNLKRGDKVVTSGGIMGTISKVTEDDIVDVEIANEVVVKISKSSISDLVSRPNPKDSSNK